MEYFSYSTQKALIPGEVKPAQGGATNKHDILQLPCSGTLFNTKNRKKAAELLEFRYNNTTVLCINGGTYGCFRKAWQTLNIEYLVTGAIFVSIHRYLIRDGKHVKLP